MTTQPPPASRADLRAPLVGSVAAAVLLTLADVVTIAMRPSPPSASGLLVLAATGISLGSILFGLLLVPLIRDARDGTRFFHGFGIRRAMAKNA